MKKTAFFFLFVASMLLMACNKDNSQVSENLQQGTWKISYFNDGGNDETSHFTNYVFTFSAGGTATAVNGNNSVIGTWSTGTDDSHAKLVLYFGTQSPFDELDEDWHILQQSATSIQLEHVSGGNGDIDLLTFTKL